METEPYLWVHFPDTGLERQADSAGKLTQWVSLGNKLVSPIQVVGDPIDNVAFSTLPVFRHWMLRQPGEAPFLSRSPAISLPVPDASVVDLQHSRLEVDGIEVPLYADLKYNRLYGVPKESLHTGLLRINVMLFQRARTPDGEPTLLDFHDWDREIVGKRTAELWIAKRSGTINGATVALEAAQFVHRASASTMLPMRFLADVMGAQIAWNGAKGQVTFKLEDRTIVLTSGSQVALVNGNSVTMATAPAFLNGRTFVPLRFVLESLGTNVETAEDHHPGARATAGEITWQRLPASERLGTVGQRTATNGTHVYPRRP